jgi:oligopeptide transport system substrate-binding protein
MCLCPPSSKTLGSPLMQGKTGDYIPWEQRSSDVSDAARRLGKRGVSSSRAGTKRREVPYSMRRYLGYTMIAACIGLMAWAVSFGTLPPADFTFCNGDEIKTVDPAISTGQPEGASFGPFSKGCAAGTRRRWNRFPGVAERWELSEDKCTYTFLLRRKPYGPMGLRSLRRTSTIRSGGSCIRRPRPSTARSFGTSGMPGALPLATSRSAIRSKWNCTSSRRVRCLMPRASSCEVVLTAIDDAGGDRPVFTVEIDGRPQRFQRVDQGAAPDGVTACRMLTFDFEQVGFG